MAQTEPIQASDQYTDENEDYSREYYLRSYDGDYDDDGSDSGDDLPLERRDQEMEELLLLIELRISEPLSHMVFRLTKLVHDDEGKMLESYRQLVDNNPLQCMLYGCHCCDLYVARGRFDIVNKIFNQIKQKMKEDLPKFKSSVVAENMKTRFLCSLMLFHVVRNGIGDLTKAKEIDATLANRATDEVDGYDLLVFYCRGFWCVLRARLLLKQGDSQQHREKASGRFLKASDLNYRMINLACIDADSALQQAMRYMFIWPTLQALEASLGSRATGGHFLYGEYSNDVIVFVLEKLEHVDVDTISTKAQITYWKLKFDISAISGRGLKGVRSCVQECERALTKIRQLLKSCHSHYGEDAEFKKREEFLKVHVYMCKVGSV